MLKKPPTGNVLAVIVHTFCLGDLLNKYFGYSPLNYEKKEHSITPEVFINYRHRRCFGAYDFAIFYKNHHTI